MKVAISVLCLLMLGSVLVIAQNATVTDQHVNPEPGTLAKADDGRYTFDADILDVYTHGFNPGQGTIIYACISRAGYSDLLEELCDWANPSDGTHSCSGDFSFNLGEYTGNFDLYFKTRFYWSGPSIWDDESDHISYTIQGDPDPALSLTPIRLDFAESSTSKTFEVWNSGGGTLTYALSESASWITGVSPASGSSTGEHDTITVTVSRSGLDADTYTEFITVSPSHGISKSVEIEMVVTEDDPVLAKSTSSLRFGSSSTRKTFQVWNDGGGSLDYEITGNKDWIVVSPVSGVSTGERDPVEVTVNRSNLPPGTHNGRVTIDPTPGSDQTVSISVTVDDSDPGEPECTLELDSHSASYGPEAAGGQIQVTADGTCDWSAYSDETWIQVPEGSGGQGNGFVYYDVVKNEGEARSGILRIEDHVYSVQQSRGTTANTTEEGGRLRVFILVGAPNPNALDWTGAAFEGAGRRLESALQTGWGLDGQTEIKLVRAAECSRARFKSQLEAFAGETDASEVLIFFYTGHGGSSGSMGSIGPNFTEGYGVSYFELDGWLRSEASETIVIIDACESGTAVNGSTAPDGSTIGFSSDTWVMTSTTGNAKDFGGEFMQVVASAIEEGETDLAAIRDAAADRLVLSYGSSFVWGTGWSAEPQLVGPSTSLNVTPGGSESFFYRTVLLAPMFHTDDAFTVAVQLEPGTYEVRFNVIGNHLGASAIWINLEILVESSGSRTPVWSIGGFGSGADTIRPSSSATVLIQCSSWSFPSPEVAVMIREKQ